MSVLRQSNFLGEQRIDVPHFRALESSIAADFDCLAGRIMTGLRPMVVRGFNIVGSTGLAKDLRLSTQDGVILHSTASESGTLYHTPADRTTELLDATRNPRVSGAFVPGQLNYVGLDLVRSVDSSTVDTVQFFDTDSEEDVPRVVPLARTLDYKIVISTVDFSLLTNVLPIAQVNTNADGTVTLIVDSRDMLFRLGAGDNQYYSYPWLTRSVPATSSFSGADKDITSFKDWMNAVMTRLWEIGGGSAWHSPASEKDVKLIRSGTTTFANGEYFDWVLGTQKVYWRGLRFIFANGEGGATYNDISDNTGGVTLQNGHCVYVDLDRTANRTGATALGHGTAALTHLSTAPDRYVIAWRSGTQIFTREAQYAVGTLYGPVATHTSNGMVSINSTPTLNGWSDNLTPMAAIIDEFGVVVGYGLTRGGETAGDIEIGGGTNDEDLLLGNVSHGISLRGPTSAVSNSNSTPALSAVGLSHSGSFPSSGGIGLYGLGGEGTGGASGGIGVMGVAGAGPLGTGVHGSSNVGFGVGGQSGSGIGVAAGSATGIALRATTVAGTEAAIVADSAGGNGVYATANSLAASAVYGRAFGANASGVMGVGKTGVSGSSSGAGSTGVSGIAEVGVSGITASNTEESVGVEADAGVSGGTPLRIVPGAEPTATGVGLRGSLYVTTTGELKFHDGTSWRTVSFT